MIKIKKLLLIILLLIIVSISSFYLKETTFFNYKEEIGDNNYIVHIKDKDIYVDLEDYVFGVVAAEMPALFNDEALKAQAIASRSYAVSSLNGNIIEISSTISDQVYQENYELLTKWEDKYEEYYSKILAAVKDTRNLVVKRNDKVLKTYYFSMSNGKTENSENVFKEDTFISVDSPYENSDLKNFEVIKEISETDLKNTLSVDEVVIEKIVKNTTNHVDMIIISGKTFTGIEFRKLFNLRSTDFTIDKDNNVYKITTRGYGHGVGMSQYGANEMAKNGYNYYDILTHYYQNCEILEI